MIGVVNYGMGNIKSMVNAIEYLGYEAIVTDRGGELSDCSHIILPGVGAFGDAVGNLRKSGLDKHLEDLVLEKKKPFLGVCLGLQLLAKTSSEHGSHKGLGWIDGEVHGLKSSREIKVPHVGWNSIKVVKEHPVFKDIKDAYAIFYFVHSFHMICNDKNDVCAVCAYGQEFPAAIVKDNIVATQFHPEKSQDNGLMLIKNFLEWGDTLVS